MGSIAVICWKFGLRRGRVYIEKNIAVRDGWSAQ